MKSCLSSNQKKEYLKQADEILVDWESKDLILDLSHDFPQTIITLSINQIQPEDWDKIIQLNRALKSKFKLCILNEKDMIQAKKQDIYFFPKTPVRAYDELHSLLALGCHEFRIAGELAHDIKNLERFPIIYRIMPNKAQVFPSIPALFGTWVRPEDIDMFPETTICEFDEPSLRREQALYRIYFQKEKWNGDLDLLVNDADDSMKNLLSVLFPDNFQEKRNTCRQACLRTGTCHWCETCATNATKNFANKIKEQYIDNKKEI